MMRALSAAELLTAWEEGRGRPPVDQALILLRLALPEVPLPRLKRLGFGQRDSLLLRLRESIFGPQVVGLFRCSGCRESVELDFRVADIQTSPALDELASFALNVDGYDVRFRLPDGADLARIGSCKDIAEAKQRLLEQVVLSVHERGEEKPTGALPTAVVDAIANRMAEADPQANVKIGFTCPSCAQNGEAVFDPVSFLLTEIDTWALRILREVHLLASAYGWPEADILAMSGWRRQKYLEMVGR